VEELVDRDGDDEAGQADEQAQGIEVDGGYLAGRDE
jgi:hypothetical protein